MCDKCRILIKYAADITEEDKKSDFHLCERCSPKDVILHTTTEEQPKKNKKVRGSK